MTASAVTDPSWLSAQLAATARRYRLGHRAGPSRTAGVLWWYSASSVLLGPAAESAVRGGPDRADPALDAITLYLHPDGRVLDARSARTVPAGELVARLARTLAAAVGAVAAASGAPEPALWAIATDSLANRVLWAGGPASVATELAAAGPMPQPRYGSVNGVRVVRRASCCLIYEAPGEAKCVSCPRQHPDERRRRLAAQLGGTTR